VNYAGTAISPDSGTNWISFLSPSSGTSVTLTNVLDSHGSATDYSITFVTSEGWDIYKDESLGNPNPLNLMSDYLFKGPYDITVSNLPPGEYNLYVYAHGDQSNQVATITVDADNGGDSGATTGYGEWRNIYQANAVSNSYLSLSATVPSSGILKFSSSDYLNGFQLRRVTTGVGPINIQSISVAGGMVNINWTSDTGAGYSIEHKTSLTGGSWTEVTNVTSSGANSTVVPASGAEQEFFRVSK
jgi:hypothetical protein